MTTGVDDFFLKAVMLSLSKHLLEIQMGISN